MRKAMVILAFVGLAALASAGEANAQRFGFGSYNSYFGGRGYSPYYGGNGYGFAPNYGGGYGGAYNRGYDYTPYYQSYGYRNVPGSYDNAEPTTRQSMYYEPESTPQYAAVTIVVPTADTQVWFGGTAMAQRGTVRVFHSPSLEAGKQFVYTIKARWVEQGKAVERDRQVDVQAGQRVTVDFRDRSENAPAPDALRPSNRTLSR